MHLQREEGSPRHPGCRSLRSLCPGLQANPPSSGLGWPSAILRPAELLPDSNNSLYTILNDVLILLTHRFRLPDMQETGPSVRQRLEAPRWGSSLLVRFAGIRFQPDRLFGITKIDGFFSLLAFFLLIFFSLSTSSAANLVPCVPRLAFCSQGSCGDAHYYRNG